MSTVSLTLEIDLISEVIGLIPSRTLLALIITFYVSNMFPVLGFLPTMFS